MTPTPAFQETGTGLTVPPNFVGATSWPRRHARAETYCTVSSFLVYEREGNEVRDVLNRLSSKISPGPRA